MKKSLLLLALCAFSLSTFAADITPARYVFANQPVGQYKIDGFSPSNWNFPGPFDGVDVNGKNLFDNGYVGLAGGPKISGEHPADDPFHLAIRKGFNIVDLGGDVGKCLVIQGPKSKYNIGTPMEETYDGTIFNLNFYTGSFDKDNRPGKTKIRFRIVFSIAEDILRTNESPIDKLYFVTYTGNPLGHLVNKEFPSKFFALKDNNGRYEEDDNGEFIYDPTIWEVFEDEVEIDDLPARLKIELKDLATATIMIKEIKFITNSTTALQQRTEMKLNPTNVAGGVFDVKAQHKTLQHSIYGNNVRFYNLNKGDNVEIFNLNGQSIKTLQATDSEMDTNLESGFYIAKSGNRVAKLIIH